MCRKIYMLSAVIALAVAAMMFFPVTGIAGSLEPSAAPAPTMKTLDQLMPSWSQKLPAAQRFEMVLDGEAVLDKETGLVWEAVPTQINPTGCAFVGCVYYCMRRNTGGRMAWHVPTIEQLASLVDVSQVSSGVTLPAGHPFGILPEIYWSISSHPTDTTRAYTVDFRTGIVSSINMFKTDQHLLWCVRGGNTYDSLY